jgi:hypothetical protein
VSGEIRLLLFAGALLTLIYFAHYIRKGRMQIDYAIYWILFSSALVLLSLFPGIATWFAKMLKIKSPANLVYLIIIFSMIVKLFTTTLKISKLNQQISELTQHIALYESNQEEQQRKEHFPE